MSIVGPIFLQSETCEPRAVFTESRISDRRECDIFEVRFWASGELETFEKSLKEVDGRGPVWIWNLEVPAWKKVKASIYGNMRTRARKLAVN